MKSLKNFGAQIALSLISILLMVAPAKAQLGYDTYSIPRTIVPSGLPTILNASSGLLTNGPIDIRGINGTAVIDVSTVTNTGGGTLTLTVLQSADQTNVTVLPNLAFIKSTTSYSYTNRIYGGTNVYATNPYLLPGTLTTKTGGSDGFVGTYMDYTTVPFTNSGALTVTAKGDYKIGFRAADAQAYIYLVWTPTGANSNDTVNASVTGIYTPGEVSVGQ